MDATTGIGQGQSQSPPPSAPYGSWCEIHLAWKPICAEGQGGQSAYKAQVAKPIDPEFSRKGRDREPTHGTHVTCGQGKQQATTGLSGGRRCLRFYAFRMLCALALAAHFWLKEFDHLGHGR